MWLHRIQRSAQNSQLSTKLSEKASLCRLPSLMVITCAAVEFGEEMEVSEGVEAGEGEVAADHQI